MADFSAKLGKLRGHSFGKHDNTSVQRNAVMDFEMDSKSKSNSLPNNYITRQSDSCVKAGRAVQVVESRRDRKKFLYKLSVEWSDGTASHAYRSYVDFFNLQCQLLDTFPEEAGARKSVRTIPFLPGRRIFARNTRGLAEQRLPEIDKYIVELLRLPNHVSSHRHVCHFFRNNWQEDLYQEGRAPPIRSPKKNKFFAFDEDKIQSDPLILESVDSVGSGDVL